MKLKMLKNPKCSLLFLELMSMLENFSKSALFGYR